MEQRIEDLRLRNSKLSQAWLKRLNSSVSVPSDVKKLFEAMADDRKQIQALEEKLREFQTVAKESNQINSANAIQQANSTYNTDFKKCASNTNSSAKQQTIAVPVPVSSLF